MFRGIVFPKWVLFGILTVFISIAVSTSQAQEQPTLADLEISNLAYELFANNILVVIELANIGGLNITGGSGQIFVKGPNDDDFPATFANNFVIGSIGAGSTSRASTSFNITNEPDGPYEVRVTITTNNTEIGTANNTLTEEFTFIREPQFRPVEIQFSPPFFDPDFVSDISINARIDNFGVQPSINTSDLEVEFAICKILEEDSCSDSAFSVFSTQTFNVFQTSEAPGFGPTPFILNTQNEIRVREWEISTCLALVISTASQGCFDSGSNLDPGTYIVRVTVDPNNLIAEVDENDNVEFARFTIPGGGGGDGVRITDMVVGVNGADARGMLWVVVDDSTLIGYDKRELERIGRCVGIQLSNSCPYENDPTRLASINQFTSAIDNPERVNLGTAIVGVFSSAFSSYDSQFVDGNDDPIIGKIILRQEDFRPARITKMVQNRSRQVLYVGLSDGRLIRYNFTDPSNIVKNELPLQAGEISALQVISRGVYVGANNPNSNNPNAQGRILFIEEPSLTILTDQFIPQSGNLIQDIHVSPSNQVFITTEQTINPSQPNLRLWWASISTQSGQITGQLSTLQEANLGNAFSGVTWDDFVVNSRRRAFMSATDNTGQSRLFAFNMVTGFSSGRETLNPTFIFGPITEFRDQCDNRVVPLGDVQFMELGDDTPNVSGDQALHIGTDSSPRLLTLKVQERNNFGIIQDVTTNTTLLNWWIQLEGTPTSVRIDDTGADRGRNPDGSTVFPNGKLFVTSNNQMVNIINGTDRTCSTPNELDGILQTQAGVLAPMDTGSGGSDFDPITFEQIPLVTAFYGGNSIYMWIGRLDDIGSATIN